MKMERELKMEELNENENEIQCNESAGEKFYFEEKSRARTVREKIVFK